MEFTVMIPARYNSSRLPGKVLLDIEGRPMLWHVYQRARSSGANEVIIATDHDAIAEVAEGFGAKVCRTSSEHQSGTERLGEVIEALGYDANEIIINLQADEPLMPASVIHQLAQSLDTHDSVKVATVSRPLTDFADLHNPNIVKVVVNRRGFAMYFSRAPIAWERDQFASKAQMLAFEHHRHVGIYGFRAGYLEEYLTMEPCSLDQAESLEQLRILWYGGRIFVTQAECEIPEGVDDGQQLERVRQHVRARNNK